MIFSKKTWVDREAEFPGRRRLKDVALGTVAIVDVTRNEGNVAQAGDTFSAENMNGLEGRIEEGFNDYEKTKKRFDSITITIPASGWSNSVPYANTVSVPGVKSSDNVDVTFRPANGATNAQNIAAHDSYVEISYANTNDGSMTFYAMETKPNANITVAIKGIGG